MSQIRVPAWLVLVRALFLAVEGHLLTISSHVLFLVHVHRGGERQCEFSGISSYKDTAWCVCVLSHFSRVRLFVTLWTIGHRAVLFMGFSR